MKKIIEKYWPILEILGCIDAKSRCKIFSKFSEQKDFRKMIKAFMRFAKKSGKNVPVPKNLRRKIRLYDNAITKLAQPSKKVSLKKRKRYIRQVGGAFPFLIPILASVVGEIIASQI